MVDLLAAFESFFASVFVSPFASGEAAGLALPLSVLVEPEVSVPPLGGALLGTPNCGRSELVVGLVAGLLLCAGAAVVVELDGAPPCEPDGAVAAGAGELAGAVDWVVDCAEVCWPEEVACAEDCWANGVAAKASAAKASKAVGVRIVLLRIGPPPCERTRLRNLLDAVCAFPVSISTRKARVVSLRIPA